MNPRFSAAVMEPSSPPAGLPQFTIAAACYGPNPQLAERFLASLYRHTSPASFVLRIGLNEVLPSTVSLVAEYAARFGNIEIFAEPENTFKSPLMRRMFTERPLSTDWVIWFDDDTHLTRSDWLQRLTLKMETGSAVAQWGKIYSLYRQDGEIERFIQAAPWFRGLPLVRKSNSAGGEVIEFQFASGGFWAMKSAVIRALDWPDPRLIQANDDFLLGEALRQHGYLIGAFDHGLKINDHPRRNAGAPEVEHLPVIPSATPTPRSRAATQNARDALEYAPPPATPRSAPH